MSTFHNKNIHLFTIVICLIIVNCVIVLGESEHRTKAAAEKLSDLYCYKCDTIGNEERCLNIKDNSTIEKCDKERICQVKTITMSTPQEEKAQPPKLWLLKRGCTKTCEPVCVTIGERTKLRACNTCCETSYCNTGNAATTPIAKYLRIFLIAFLTLFINVRCYSKQQFIDDAKTNYANKY